MIVSDKITAPTLAEAKAQAAVRHDARGAQGWQVCAAEIRRAPDCGVIITLHWTMRIYE